MLADKGRNIQQRGITMKKDAKEDAREEEREGRREGRDQEEGTCGRSQRWLSNERPSGGVVPLRRESHHQ